MKQVKLERYKGQEFFVGIDVHKKSWNITVRSAGIGLKTFNMYSATPEILHKYLINNYPDGRYNAVYEAGFLGFWIARRLKKHGVNCMVVHPADIPTKHKERAGKSDPVDSRKLARELEHGSLEGIYIPDPADEELCSLVRLRMKNVIHQSRIKHQIKSKLYQYGIELPDKYKENRWSGAFIKWLEQVKFSSEYGNYVLTDLLEQLEEIRNRVSKNTKEIRRILKENGLSLTIKYLMTVPGIGLIVAMTLYTELKNMRRFSNINKLANYVGLVPSTASSGETEKEYGITKRRKEHLRKILVESAWSSLRKDPVMLNKYNDLCKRMNGKTAIIRIAKKLLSRTRYVWLNQQEYVSGLIKYEAVA